MPTPLRVVYFGTTAFAAPPLKALMEDPRTEVVLVVSQPDRTAGRGMKNMKAWPVAELARDTELPLIQPETLKDDAVRVQLANTKADLFIVAAYGKIVSQTILDMPRIAPLNLHGSLLPAYRGASPIQAALLDGIPETGVSLMRMDAKMDHGPVYATAMITITDTMDYEELESRLSVIATDLLMDSLAGIVDGSLEPEEQDHDAATFCTMIKKSDGEVIWGTHDADHVVRMTRAYAQWPGCFTFWTKDGIKKRLSIETAEALPETDLAPGVVGTDVDGFPIVGTKKGAVRLVGVKPEGKPVMNGKAFLAGHATVAGSSLG